MSRTLPNYKEIALNLYNLIVNLDVGYLIAVAEIEHALEQAQRVGYTLGVEDESNRWWTEQDTPYTGEHD